MLYGPHLKILSTPVVPYSAIKFFDSFLSVVATAGFKWLITISKSCACGPWLIYHGFLGEQTCSKNIEIHSIPLS